MNFYGTYIEFYGTYTDLNGTNTDLYGNNTAAHCLASLAWLKKSSFSRDYYSSQIYSISEQNV